MILGSLNPSGVAFGLPWRGFFVPPQFSFPFGDSAMSSVFSELGPDCGVMDYSRLTPGMNHYMAFHWECIEAQIWLELALIGSARNFQ